MKQQQENHVLLIKGCFKYGNNLISNFSVFYYSGFLIMISRPFFFEDFFLSLFLEPRWCAEDNRILLK